MDYSIRFPARPKASGSSYYDVFDMQVDIDNDKIDLVSEDQKSRISLDLASAVEFEKVLHGLVNSEQFQTALNERSSKAVRRYRCGDQEHHENNPHRGV